MDEVLLVASSRSFAAVNREQFYVSISRGRERCHVFTDDADLLARRVTDSHERKAAVELQALRDELAKLGFLPRPQLKEKTTSPAVEGFRTVRPMRQVAVRQHRATRLSPVQRLALVVEDVRRWCALDQKEAVEQPEPVKQTEKISPDLKQPPERTTRRSLREQVRQSIEDYHKRQQQRRSGGIRT